MIVVDTSALMAMLLEEPEASQCRTILKKQDFLLISAGTAIEALIVANGRNIMQNMANLIENLGLDVVPVTSNAVNRIGDIYQKWGKGNHKAALNFGDCFAYELASSRHCPLLYIGNDFAQTDIQSCF